MTPIGYCTNVHPGQSLLQTIEQLDHYTSKVKENCQEKLSGVGLWFNQTVCQQLIESTQQTALLQEKLNQLQVQPYTLNGFPYGDFHQEIVKTDVYQPDWTDQNRLRYTKNLATLLATLLKNNGETFGSISTLPLGWKRQQDQPFLKAAATNLCHLADFLTDLEDRTGVQIQVCIEPEPGCTLGTTKQTVNFFQSFIKSAGNWNRNKRHLSICYDTCHAAVMNESVEENLDLISHTDLEIGKVQVSNAPSIDFDSIQPQQQDHAWDQLKQFTEAKYLHQTSVHLKDADEVLFFEDLPIAFGEKSLKKRGRWVVHFHVPIFCDKIGFLGTTSEHNSRLIELAEKKEVVIHHWEVETYAWNVLPKENQPDCLADGISKEVDFLHQLLKGTRWQK